MAGAAAVNVERVHDLVPKSPADRLITGLPTANATLERLRRIVRRIAEEQGGRE
jgi:hypothetical protein